MDVVELEEILGNVIEFGYSLALFKTMFNLENVFAKEYVYDAGNYLCNNYGLKHISG